MTNFTVLSKTECKSVYYQFRGHYESSDFRKLPVDKLICQEIYEYLIDYFISLVVNSNIKEVSV